MVLSSNLGTLPRPPGEDAGVENVRSSARAPGCSDRRAGGVLVGAAGRRARSAGRAAGVVRRLFEGVDGRLLKAEHGALAGGGVPRIGAAAEPRRLDEGGDEPSLYDITVYGVVMRGDGARESCGALRAVPDRGDRGQAGQGHRPRTEGQVLAER